MLEVSALNSFYGNAHILNDLGFTDREDLLFFWNLLSESTVKGL